MYAKLIIIENERIPTIKIFATKHKERLSKMQACDYVFTGRLDEFHVCRFLKETKPTELEIPNEIVEELSLGFYRNYKSILKIT